jgi:hypothetical protein
MSKITEHHSEQNRNRGEHEDLRQELIMFGNGVQLSEDIGFIQARKSW